MSDDRHGWRGPHQWEVTRRSDYSNGYSTIRFRCPCGVWHRISRILTDEADDIIAEYLGGDR